MNAKQWFDSLRLDLDVWRAGHIGPGRLAEIQGSRLAELVSFARQNSPYFAEKYADLPAVITDVRQLPRFTKRELVAHCDRIVTDPQVTLAGVEAFVADPARIGSLYLGRYSTWVTSGSTGLRAIILGDHGWRRVMSATNRVRFASQQYNWIGLLRRLRGGGRSAYLIGMGTHFTAVSMATSLRNTRAWKQGRITIVPITLPLAEVARRLNEFRPTMLCGYASAITILADEQQAGRLHIRPRLVVNASETLSPADRRLIQATFGCQVRDLYSCSETGTLAFECARGALHVNADWVILEPVDENYQPTLPGEPSNNILVTNLANRILPILRYELRDQVTIHPQGCRCGLTLPVISILGRTDDVLNFQASSGQRIKVLPRALSSVIKQTPDVLCFQVIQTGDERMKLRLEIGSAHDASQAWQAVIENLRTYLDSQGLQNVQLLRDTEPPQRDPRSNKLREAWIEYER
ncbi:MAG: phenylacetate--CoA ligase family protein [Anaerolineales bacterium]|nr:phenylacetate--CoA ligase family protein [Anaerolineales bacterium]